MYSIKEVHFGLQTYVTETFTMRQFHRHDDVQLGFYERGPVLYQLGEKIYRIEANEYVMCWSGIPHILRETPIDNIQRWITIPLDIFIRWNLSSHITNALLSGELLKMHEPDYNAIDIVMFPQWATDLQQNDIAYRELVTLAFEARFRRFCLLYETHKINAESTAYQDSSIFARIYQYIRENFAQKISIDDIAKELKIHPNYAMTVCKKKSGYTIHYIISMIRIHEAQRLLISSELTVIDIAFESGFSTMSNFYYIFKKYCGVTPKEYRKKSMLS